MVVAVGLIVVEPLADVDVKVPGVIAMLVAPATTQLKLLPAPELILAGFAVKDVIVGTALFAEGALADVVEPQPASPIPAKSTRTRVQRSGLKELRSRQLGVFSANELVEPMNNGVTDPSHSAQSIAHATSIPRINGRSPVSPRTRVHNRVALVIRRCTLEGEILRIQKT